MHLLKANPFFGTSPVIYLNDPILLRSMQGEGIIDLTNTYLLLMIRSGIFSVLSFLAIWIVLCKGLCHIEAPNDTASVLMACCVVTAVMLFICSPFSFIPVYYWFLIGLVVGFLRNHSLKKTEVR
jgi:O-antigen ligase